MVIPVSKIRGSKIVQTRPNETGTNTIKYLVPVPIA